MRSGLIFFVFVFLVVAGLGQRAPDIAVGTSAAEVVKVYGWPKGKSVTEDRESWLYDRFQVLFQHGKVVSVSYIASTAPEPFLLGAGKTVGAESKPAISAPTGSTAQTPAAVKATTPATRSVTTSSRPARHAPESDYLVVPTKTKSAEPTRSASSSVVWLVSGFSAVGVLVGLLILSINRREAAKKLADDLLQQKRREVFQKPKTWEEEVAEKLNRANGAEKSGGGGKSAEARGADAARGDWDDVARRHAGGTPAVPGIDPARGDLSLELLRKLEWKRFELIVALYYRATGVDAECTCSGPDGGVDVKLRRQTGAAAYCYIQCKAWGSEKVKLTTMREFLGVMASDKVAEGIFITTSDFRPEAREFAERNGITPLTACDFIANFKRLPLEARTRILAEVTQGDYTTPSCPACTAKMVWKPQQSFWSCPQFPRCRSQPIHPRADRTRSVNAA
jgi:hypothetical protein